MKRWFICVLAAILCAAAIGVVAPLQAGAAAADYIVFYDKNDTMQISDAGEYTKFSGFGASAEGRVGYKEKVPVEGLEVTMYSDTCTKDSYYGFYFSDQMSSSVYFGKESPLGVTVWKHQIEKNNQDRIHFGADHAYNNPSFTYIQPDTSSTPASNKSKDQTWVMNGDDDSGIKIKFSSYNEDWYQINMTPVNTTMFSGEVDTLYMQKSVLSDILDDDGKVYICFSGIKTSDMYVNVSVPVEEEDAVDYGKFTGIGLENVSVDTDGNTVFTLTSETARFSLKNSIDLQSQNGMTANLQLTEAAQNSVLRLSYFSQQGAAFGSGTGLSLVLTTGETSVAEIYTNNTKFAQTTLSEKLENGSLLRFGVAFGPIYDDQTQTFVNGYTITVNETEVAAVPESQLSAVSLTPTEAYFTISCAEIYPTTITFAGIDNDWYYSDQAKDIIASGAQNVTNLESGLYFEVNESDRLYIDSAIDFSAPEGAEIIFTMQNSLPDAAAKVILTLSESKSDAVNGEILTFTMEVSTSEAVLTLSKGGIEIDTANSSFDGESTVKIVYAESVWTVNIGDETLTLTSSASSLAYLSLSGSYSENEPLCLLLKKAGTLTFEKQLPPMPVQLKAPQISLNGNTVTWNEVENAAGYEVYVNGEKQASEAEDCSFVIPYTNAGNYIVTVKAIGDGSVYLSSEESNSVMYTVTDPEEDPGTNPGTNPDDDKEDTQQEGGCSGLAGETSVLCMAFTVFGTVILMVRRKKQ